MKKIPLIIAFILLVNIKSFAINGFVAILNVPVGLSVCIADGLILGEPLTKLGVNTGINAKLGYMFDLGSIGITPLFEFGYSYDTYGAATFSETKFAGNLIRQSLNMILITHSLQMGVIPQINIGNVAIGLGFGLKIPLAAEYEYKRIDSSYGSNKVEENIKNKLNRKDIENAYGVSIIPYIKLSFELQSIFYRRISCYYRGIFRI